MKALFTSLPVRFASDRRGAGWLGVLGGSHAGGMAASFDGEWSALMVTSLWTWSAWTGSISTAAGRIFRPWAG